MYGGLERRMEIRTYEKWACGRKVAAGSNFGWTLNLRTLNPYKPQYLHIVA